MVSCWFLGTFTYISDMSLYLLLAAHASKTEVLIYINLQPYSCLPRLHDIFKQCMILNKIYETVTYMFIIISGSQFQTHLCIFLTFLFLHQCSKPFMITYVFYRCNCTFLSLDHIYFAKIGPWTLQLKRDDINSLYVKINLIMHNLLQ